MMNKKMRKTMAILCVASMLLSTTGCAPKFDASEYVQAELDLLTQHNVEQYVKVMGVTEAEAEEIYSEGIAEMSVAMQDLESAGLPEDLMNEYEQWFLDLFTLTKYTVLEEEKTDDGYIVPVEVEPIRAFADAPDKLTEQFSTYLEDMMTSVMNGEEAPSEEQINIDTFTMLLDIVDDNIENPTYAEKQTIEVKIAKNADGLYEPNESDIENLGAMMIDVSDFENLQ